MPPACGCSQQPPLCRVPSSGPFYFQHRFAREHPGRLAECYDLEAQIGSGAYGQAFRATCRRSGLSRAVKAVPLLRERDLARLEVEISIARQLDHPNIVRLYETFCEAQKVYMVMELCSGGELFDRVLDQAPNGFKEVRSASYTRQMLSAVCYLHANHIAHRDIKPENFLLQTASLDSELKLIDFGLASAFQPGLPMSTKVGTPFYVAPEVLAGAYSELCDVWSVGIIAYILLCGYPPFHGKTDREILRHVRNGAFSFPATEWDRVSQQGKELVTHMLTSDPAARHSAGVALKHPWVLREVPEVVPSLTESLGEDFIKRLQTFHGHARLKRVALTAVARQLSDDATEGLQRAFRTLDKNGDGMISPDEVYEILLTHGFAIPETFDDVLHSVDSDGSGWLDYMEFVAAVIDDRVSLQRDVCMAAYHSMDLDGDGKISKSDLSHVLFCDEFERVLRQDKVDKMFREADADCDGFIDFDEFCRVLTEGCGMQEVAGPALPCSGEKEGSADSEVLFGDHLALQHRKPRVASGGSLSTTASEGSSSSTAWDATPY